MGFCVIPGHGGVVSTIPMAVFGVLNCCKWNFVDCKSVIEDGPLIVRIDDMKIKLTAGSPAGTVAVNVLESTLLILIQGSNVRST